MTSDLLKRISIGGLIILCAFLMIYFIIGAEKPYQHLRIDNLSSIELCDSNGTSIADIDNESQMKDIITCIGTTRTYNNVMMKDIPKERYRFQLHYDDGRMREIIVAVEQEGDLVADTQNLCITVNKRWYRIKQDQAQALLDLYVAMS